MFYFWRMKAYSLDDARKRHIPYSPHIISFLMTLVLSDKLPMFLFIFFHYILFVVFYDYISPPDHRNFQQEIQTKMKNELQKINDLSTQIEKIKTRKAEEQQNINENLQKLEQELYNSKNRYKNLQTIKYIVSREYLHAQFLIPLSDVLNTETLPGFVSQNFGIETKKLQPGDFENLMKQNIQLQSYLNYFRSIYIWQQLNHFSFTFGMKALMSAESARNDDFKKALIDNFLGEILNQYKLIIAPINLLRFYKDDTLNRIKHITEAYAECYVNRSKLPHLLCVGSKNQVFSVIHALKSKVPPLYVNNIDFQYNESNNIFKRGATHAQKTNLFAKLINQPINFKHHPPLTIFLMSYLRMRNWLLGARNKEIVLNLLDYSHFNRGKKNIEENVNTNEQLNILPFQDDENIILGFSQDFSIDTAVVDRFTFQIILHDLTFDEFYQFFRQVFLEYLTFCGDCLVESENLEIGQIIYTLAHKIYYKIRHIEITDQLKIITNVLNFMRSNKSKYNFKEVLDALK
jgi:hypothetical protein